MVRAIILATMLLAGCGGGGDPGDVVCVNTGICGDNNRVDSPSADNNAGTANSNNPSSPHGNPVDNSTHVNPTPTP